MHNTQKLLCTVSPWWLCLSRCIRATQQRQWPWGLWATPLLTISYIRYRYRSLEAKKFLVCHQLFTCQQHPFSQAGLSSVSPLTNLRPLQRICSTNRCRIHPCCNLSSRLLRPLPRLLPPIQYCLPRHCHLLHRRPISRPPTPLDGRHLHIFSAWSSVPLSAFQAQAPVSWETNSLLPMKWLPV